EVDSHERHHPLSITDAAVPDKLPIPSQEPEPEDHKLEQPQTEQPQLEADPGQVVLGKLRVSSVTPNSVQLQWSVPEGFFDSFTLQYRDAQGQPQALAVDGGSRSVTVPGLSPSRRYRFHLYGLQGRKKIDRVSTDVVTGDEEASEEPLPSEEPQEEKPQTESPTPEALPARAVLGELKVSSVTPNSVGLQWSVPEGSFDSFLLQYRDAQGQPQALPVDGGSHSVTVPGLSPSRRYRFHLYGLRGAKRVDRVSTDVVTEELQPVDPEAKDPQTEATPSEAPLPRAVLEELRVSSISPSSVGLQWTVPKGSFDSFLLQYRDAQGQPQALPVDGGSRSVTVS
ncbi:TENX protein, partial [Picathartes gymnocephalus]|nr:TENX protein [Picathartes gymnocephalus]